MPSDTFKDHIYALMVAGGGGTRLWPMSREGTPKQFLKLFHNKTLIEITAQRISEMVPWEKIFVVTTTKLYGDEISKLLPQIPHANIMVEPVRKDTAAAHGLGAAYIYSRDPNAVIVNAAVDHFIHPDSAYKKTMMAAAKAAYDTKKLVAIGITPEYPHTGLGYLKRGKRFGLIEGKVVYVREKHVEKPTLANAKRFVDSGNYYWNANHYVWRADNYLEELKLHAPQTGQGMQKIIDAIGTSDESKVISSVYDEIPKISVDYAVSERTKNFLMIVADYSWTDIGDWNEVWKNLPKDESGNVVICGHEEGCGEIINIDTTDALIHSDGRLIAIIDVDNVVVVDTKEALLICSKSRAQSVKKIVERLKEEKKEQYL